ncbi:MAG: prolipoprotein diacylglyceryl transferase [Tepidisphaeraceae bacterium]
MLRELFTIPGIHFTIYGYGLMLVIACLSAIALAKFLARRCGIDPEHFVNIGVIALLAGVIGARAAAVIQEWSHYTDGTLSQNLYHMINLREGGLTYYGGLILATPACIAYGLWHKIPILRGMDIVAPALMIGLGIGRIGCFVNGCCYGETCDLPWAVQFPYGSPPYEDQALERKISIDPQLLITPSHFDPKLMQSVPDVPRLRTKSELTTPAEQAAAASAKSLPVHPAQLYSTIMAFIVAGACVAYFTMSPGPGRVFGLMMLMEGFGRFTLEQLRVEPPVLHLGRFAWSASMTIGVGLMIAGTIALLVLRRRATPVPA